MADEIGSSTVELPVVEPGLRGVMQPEHSFSTFTCEEVLHLKGQTCCSCSLSGQSDVASEVEGHSLQPMRGSVRCNLGED